MPVDRQNCTEGTEKSPAVNEDSMNVTWHLSFSGRTPGKFIAAEFMPPDIIPHDHTASEFKIAQAHDNAEVISTLLSPCCCREAEHIRWSYGPQVRRKCPSETPPCGICGTLVCDNSHARQILQYRSSHRAVVRPILGILDIHYWYTSSSTQHISVPGTVMRASGRLIYLCSNVLASSKRDKLGSDDWGQWLWLLLSTLATGIVTPLLMLTAAFRLYIDWKGWLPKIRRSPPTHLERASERVEARTPGYVMIIVRCFPLCNDDAQLAQILTVMIIFHFILQPDNYFLVSPVSPLPTEEDWPTDNSVNFSASLLLTGWLLQLILSVSRL